ncbi:sugar O-acetyltransferase [Terrihalobacillus insolitus]|uniref:sugar O-acetyltransferase n=1 Tax=Terrihalobacillus insolitus TaxID=2950438 RepID=UPI00234167D0|nr:sugar O-acetyltransferase [Terrihalobacillus insolitus]MDC3412028.1 sugar O-acetyltransferase [Terrihalobacillus insolitus]
MTTKSTKSEKQKMLDGDLYHPSDPQLVEEKARARKLTRAFNETPESKLKKREEIIKSLFGSTGSNLYMESNFHCDYGYNIHIGENFYANYDCVMLDGGTITIGDNSMIAPGVHIYTAGHPMDPTERSTGIEYTKPVVIGDNVWIGGRSVINPGVTVGNNVVVASGSVVTKDIPDNAVVAGVPTKVIKYIKF